MKENFALKGHNVIAQAEGLGDAAETFFGEPCKGEINLGLSE